MKLRRKMSLSTRGLLICALILALYSSPTSTLAVCTFNTSCTACIPTNHLNLCDTQGWCVRREQISIVERPVSLSQCLFNVDVTIDYTRCTDPGAGTIPYSIVMLYLVKKPRGCTMSDADLGDYPVTRFICDGQPVLTRRLYEIGNPNCPPQDSHTYSTVVPPSSPNCDNPPEDPIDLSFTRGDPDRYYWEVELIYPLTAPLGVTGRQRTPASSCYISPTPSGSPGGSPSGSPGGSPGGSEPHASPSEEPPIIIECTNPVETLPLNSLQGNSAATFGAVNNLEPMGPTISLQSATGGLGGTTPGSDPTCLFVITFGNSLVSSGESEQKHFALPPLPPGTSNPVLYTQTSAAIWTPVPNQDFRDGTLYVAPNTFGYFQVFSTIINPKPEILDSYVYPNPSKDGDIPTLHVGVKVTTDVYYRIYDMAGDLIDQGKFEKPIQSQNGETYYEKALNPKLFKSGVYLYAVTTEKQNKSDGKTTKSRKNGKFTVVR